MIRTWLVICQQVETNGIVHNFFEIHNSIILLLLFFSHIHFCPVKLSLSQPILFFSPPNLSPSYWGGGVSEHLCHVQLPASQSYETFDRNVHCPAAFLDALICHSSMTLAEFKAAFSGRSRTLSEDVVARQHMQLPNMWLPPLPNVCDWHKLLIFSNLLIIDTSGSVDGCTPSFFMSLM